VCAKGCALLQGSWRSGDVSGGRRTACTGELSVSSAREQSEWASGGQVEGLIREAVEI
jgi:hypothetical protein